MENSETATNYNEIFKNKEILSKIAEAILERKFSNMVVQEALFSIYISEIYKKHYEDLRVCSDVTLADMLNISITKAMKFKDDAWENGSIKFITGWWKKPFWEATKTAEVKAGRVQVVIPDRFLYRKLVSFVDAKVSKGSNLLILSREDFVKLKMQACDADKKQNVNKEVIKAIKDSKQSKSKINSKNWIDSLPEIAKCADLFLTIVRIVKEFM